MTAGALRDTVVAALAGVADQLAELAPGQRSDPADRLDVRAAHVGHAIGCGAAAALDGEGPFVPSAAVAGWSAAATAADRLVHGHVDPRKGAPPTDPAAALRLLWQERAQLDGWPWDWHRDEAAPADRALVAAEVARRVAALARAFDGWPPPGATHVGHQPTWLFPNRPLRLKGRVDVVLGKRDGTHTLVVALGGDHGPATRGRLAYEALVEALALRRAPAVVVGLHPAAGRRWPVTVDDALLAEGVEVAGEAARVALGVRRRSAGGLARRPGPRCRSCAHRSGCPEGEAWLAGPGRLRSGFLPPP